MRKSFVGGAPYRIAKVKAVELRQKNRDELLTEIENYKKELSQVFLLYSISPSSSCQACPDQGRAQEHCSCFDRSQPAEEKRRWR